MLDADYSLRKNKNLYFAGQITGVEGYVESTASGLVAGINAYRASAGQHSLIFPKSTATGALAHYISSSASGNFQPMNINFGIIEGINEHIRDKRAKNRLISEKALKAVENISES